MKVGFGGNQNVLLWNKKKAGPIWDPFWKCLGPIWDPFGAHYIWGLFWAPFYLFGARLGPTVEHGVPIEHGYL